MSFALSTKQPLSTQPDKGKSPYWGSGLLLALLLHAGIAFWMVYRATQELPPATLPAAIFMLQPAEQQESTTNPEKLPDGVKQALSAPQEVETPQEEVPLPKLAEAPKPVIQVAKKVVHKVKPKSQPVKPPEKEILPAPTPPAPVTSAPPDSQQQRVAAPASSSASTANPGQTNWVGLLRQRLDRYKRYPAQAARQQAQGVAYLGLTLDRQGKVLNVRLVKSSGVSSLDREALALPERASPLPPPPGDFAPEKQQVTLTIPINFNLNQ